MKVLLHFLIIPLALAALIDEFWGQVYFAFALLGAFIQTVQKKDKAPDEGWVSDQDVSGEL